MSHPIPITFRATLCVSGSPLAIQTCLTCNCRSCARAGVHTIVPRRVAPRCSSARQPLSAATREAGTRQHSTRAMLMHVPCLPGAACSEFWLLGARPKLVPSCLAQVVVGHGEELRVELQHDGKDLTLDYQALHTIRGHAGGGSRAARWSAAAPQGAMVVVVIAVDKRPRAAAWRAFTEIALFVHSYAMSCWYKSRACLARPLGRVGRRTCARQRARMI